MVKLIAFDIDGTLLVKHKLYIPDSTIDSIKKLQAQNVICVLASGRPVYSIAKELLDLHFDFIIGCNGSYIVDSQGQPIFVSYFDEVTTLSLARNFSALADTLVFRYIDENKIVCGANRLVDLTKTYFKQDQLDEINLVADYDNTESKLPIAALCYINSTHLAFYTENYPNLRFVEAGSEDFYDITLIDIDKGVTLERLCLSLKIDRQDIIAFGDDVNDIQMIEYAGIGVAMGNANSKLKKVADLVTDDIEDNGIIKALSHLGIFGQKID